MIKFNTFKTAMQSPFDCICASFCVYSLSTSLFMQYLPQWEQIFRFMHTFSPCCMLLWDILITSWFAICPSLH